MADELVKKRITEYGTEVAVDELDNSDVIFVDSTQHGTRKLRLKGIRDIISGIQNESIKSSGVSVTADNYATTITNVNDQPVNTIYAYAAGLQLSVTNLPSNNALNIMHYTYKYSVATNVGQVQIAIERSGENPAMYFRTTGGTPVTWGSWVKVANNADIEAIREELDNLDIETDTTLSISGKPADAKAAGDAINDLKADLTYKTDNVYGGDTTATYLIATGGKTWHSTLGTLVNNTKRAASEQILYTPDMKQLDVTSSYRMIVYGNNGGIGNSLTQVSSTGVVTYNLASFPYKYIYIVVFKQDQSEISSDLTDVLSLLKYDAPLSFALVNDLADITNNVGDNRESIKDIEEDVGVKHIILTAHKLGNFAISANGEIAGAISTRVATVNKIQIWANAPTYIAFSSGFFRPLLYLFKNGSFTSMVNNHVNGNTYDADEVRMLFFKNPNTQDITPQEVADRFTMWQVKTDSLPNRISALENVDVEHNDYSLIAYGDSLTTGAGATNSNHTYWGVCATQLAMKSRIGFGFGGSQSKAIAWTAGGLSAYVPPNVRTFNMKYADLESNVTIAANALNGKTVIVNGNEYTISQTETTSYSLPNEYTPSNIYLPIVNKNSRYTADIYVIWMGTNDNGMQWDLIDAMIAKLPHKKYVVMGLTRLGTDTSVEDEQKGYKQYGSHFLNTRVQIINNAFQILEETPTAEDTAAMSNGLMPPSLLVDGLHFNDSGYEVIGKLLAKHITALGYDFQTN